MNDVLELTSIEVKSKKLERLSGKLASKVRFTPATFQSMKSKTSEQIAKTIAKYNETYAQLRSAIVSAEVAAAEQEARNSAVIDPKAKKEEEQREAQIQEDNQIAVITSVEVTKPRLTSLKLDIHKLTGRFGKLKDNFGINVKKGFIPKALSVPKMYSKAYSAILKNCDLYKLADKVGAIDPAVAGVVPTPAQEKTVAATPKAEEAAPVAKKANWKGLFDSDESATGQDVVVAMDNHSNPDEEELEFIPVESRGVSSEELSHRKMIGQIGEELKEVRRIRESSHGVATPFTAGLNERENSLLSMLSSLSGVEEIGKGIVVDENKVDNTEFQDLIEHLVGYKDPVTEEEHMEKEKSLQDYYSDPEVSKTIDELRHKDVLYAFNQPEAYEKVMAAERKDNERVAAMSTAIDVLDSTEDVLDDANNTIMALDALRQAEMIKQQEDDKVDLIEGAKEQAKLIEEQIEHEALIEGAKEQAQMIEEQEERQALIEGAKEQAQMIEQEVEFQNILEGAKEQAKLLSGANEAQEEHQALIEGAKEQARLLEQDIEYQKLMEGAKEQAQLIQQQIDYENIKIGALEQAKMLKTLYDFMDKQEALERTQQEEQDSLLEGAKEQAQQLMQQAEKDEIIEGAKDQAQQLVQQAEKDEVIEGAKDQARQLQAGNELIEVMDSAKVEARNLLAKNEQADIINGSEEQAKMLNDIPPQVDVMEQLAAQIVYENTSEDNIEEGAVEQARMLQENNERADIINGSVEQAQMLQLNNEMADLINGSEEQARMLQDNNERADLINGSFEQAKLLQEYNDRIDLINISIEQAKLLQAYNERADVINGAVEQAKLLFEKIKKPVTNNVFEKLNFELVDKNDRYGIYMYQSKPIKLKAVHMANMNSRLKTLSSSDLTNRRATLNSLKDQLDSENLDFLRYSDDVLKGTEAA